MKKQRKIAKQRMPKAPRIAGPRPFNLFAQRNRSRFRDYIGRVRGFANR